MIKLPMTITTIVLEKKKKKGLNVHMFPNSWEIMIIWFYGHYS